MNEPAITFARQDALPTASAESFSAALTTEIERRKLLKSYIHDGLTEGVDYGTITDRKSGKPITSTPCLLKPGAEKFCSLLDLMPRFTADTDTIAMLPDTIRAGTFLFKCELIHRKSGQIIAEGRGACSMAEKYGNVNTAIKIAEKRAQVDAVLRLGLSDSFTQDIDDMEHEPAQPTKAAEIKLDPTRERLKIQAINLYNSMKNKTGAQAKFINSLNRQPLEKIKEAIDKMTILVKEQGQ